MHFVGVVLARAPAAGIFLAYKNSVNFVPGLFLAPVPLLSREAITTCFLSQALSSQLLFSIEQTPDYPSDLEDATCFSEESSLTHQAG